MGHLPEECYTELAKKNSSLSFTLSFFCAISDFCSVHQSPDISFSLSDSLGPALESYLKIFVVC
jgi:hypothetical protein